MEKLTLERLLAYREHNNFHETVKYAQSFEISYPEKPIKPYLKVSTSAEAKQYAHDLEVYEQSMPKYHEAVKVRNQEQNRIYDILKDFIKEEAGINNVPAQYREKVWTLAWEHGHSSGFVEVYNYLSDLIDIFE